MTYCSPSEVTPVINVSYFLLEIKLDPVMEPDDIVISALSNKHVFKPTGIVMPKTDKVHL